MTEVIQEKDAWEKQYESGEWQFLDGKAEAVRNSVLAQYVHWDERPITVLDLGCGSAAILKHLNLPAVSSYTGLDLAQGALDRVVIKRAQDHYICGSLETFTPKTKWDVIIFNEVLYYLKDPVAEVVRFESALTDRGHFVISMHKKQSWFAYNNQCIRRLTKCFEERGYTTLDCIDLTRVPSGTSWRVFAVAPGKKQAGST